MDIEKKSDFNRPAHYHPSQFNMAQQGQPRGNPTFDISRVQCWDCGKLAHFGDKYPSEPLPVDRLNLRKSIFAERKRVK